MPTEKQPIVSVVCLTYNQEDVISDALDSILAQITTFHFNVLVHDDCSQDKTVEVVRRYQELYPERIELITEEENQYQQGKSVLGVVSKFISSKYVAICDGDDYWTSSNKLQKQYDYLESHAECALVCHAADVTEAASGRVIDELSIAKVESDFTVEDIIERGGWTWAASSMFFRSEGFMLPSAYSGWGVGDFPRSIYLATMGPVHYFPEKMSVYRQGGKSSWTQQMREDGTALARSLQKRANGLERFNEATEYRYNACVTKRVALWKCEACICTHDWKSLLLGSTFPYFKSLSLLSKIKTIIKILIYR